MGEMADTSYPVQWRSTKSQAWTTCLWENIAQFSISPHMKACHDNDKPLCWRSVALNLPSYSLGM